MYPYNRNTHYFQRQSLTAREAKDPAIAELAEDDRLLALLKVAAEELKAIFSGKESKNGL